MVVRSKLAITYTNSGIRSDSSWKGILIYTVGNYLHYRLLLKEYSSSSIFES